MIVLGGQHQGTHLLEINRSNFSSPSDLIAMLDRFIRILKTKYYDSLSVDRGFKEHKVVKIVIALLEASNEHYLTLMKILALQANYRRDGFGNKKREKVVEEFRILFDDAKKKENSLLAQLQLFERFLSEEEELGLSYDGAFSIGECRQDGYTLDAFFRSYKRAIKESTDGKFSLSLDEKRKFKEHFYFVIRGDLERHKLVSRVRNLLATRRVYEGAVLQAIDYFERLKIDINTKGVAINVVREMVSDRIAELENSIDQFSAAAGELIEYVHDYEQSN